MAPLGSCFGRARRACHVPRSGHLADDVRCSKINHSTCEVTLSGDKVTAHFSVGTSLVCDGRVVHERSTEWSLDKRVGPWPHVDIDSEHEGFRVIGRLFNDEGKIGFEGKAWDVVREFPFISSIAPHTVERGWEGIVKIHGSGLGYRGTAHFDRVALAITYENGDFVAEVTKDVTGTVGSKMVKVHVRDLSVSNGVMFTVEEKHD